MSLPIQKAPQYKCELPISGIEVNYRPFLVKEQQHLLIARESEDATAVFDAIMNLINSVTEGKIDGSELPLVDVEYLFLQIRTKSIGETAKIPLMCMDDECDGVGVIEMDLTTIKVDTSSIMDNKIQLNEN